MKGKTPYKVDVKALHEAAKAVVNATTQMQAIELITQSYCKATKSKVSPAWILTRLKDLGLLEALPKGQRGRAKIKIDSKALTKAVDNIVNYQVNNLTEAINQITNEYKKLTGMSVSTAWIVLRIKESGLYDKLPKSSRHKRNNNSNKYQLNFAITGQNNNNNNGQYNDERKEFVRTCCIVGKSSDNKEWHKIVYGFGKAK